MIDINIGNSWDDILKDIFESEKIKNLIKILNTEYEKYRIFPHEKDIFNSLKLTPYEKVKIVILGQDPYQSTDSYGNSHAMGLSFSSKSPYEIPKSLKNIFKELKNEYNEDFNIPETANLTKWAEQGVLLLNTVLTVRQDKSNSHRNWGWELLTNKIIELLGKSDKAIVFMLWGNQAQKNKKFITGINKLILESSHPSPLSAYHSFFDNNHFKRANAFLKEHNLEEINWNL